MPRSSHGYQDIHLERERLGAHAFRRPRHAVELIRSICRHLDRAILQTKAEVDAMGKSHTDLANLMRVQESQVSDFLNKRETARKSVSSGVSLRGRLKR